MSSIILDDSSRTNGVYVLSETIASFESLYIKLRKKENRLYDDREVFRLPGIDKNHIHYSEWKIRAKTSKRFINYLVGLTGCKSVLDIGCGNGWFTSIVAKNTEANVYGLDINKTELEQAARVFNQKNLKFIYGNIFNNVFYNSSFDLITLNASIQYFSNYKNMIDLLLTLLNENGEIHILDSPFYNKDTVNAARKRTAAYYSSIGFPEMATYYFHHSRKGLAEYDYTLLFNPHSGLLKLKRIFRIDTSPFPWIKIVKT